MNIFKNIKVSIVGGIMSVFLMFFVLVSLVPNIVVAGPRWDAFKETAWYPPNWFPDRSGSIKIGDGPTKTFGSGSSVSGINRTPENFNELIMNTIIGGILRPVVTLIVSLAIVVFLYGVFKFIRSDGKEKESGKQFMLWGIVGIFVMVSMWGLVNILRGTFNLNDTEVGITGALLK